MKVDSVRTDDSPDMDGHDVAEMPNRFLVFLKKELSVRESVLEAIKQGQWDFEPQSVKEDEYISTVALPGSNEKIGILAERAKDGLPLWHPEDRKSYDDTDEALV